MRATVKIEHDDGAEEFVDYELSEDQVEILQTYCDDAWKLRTSEIFGEKAANTFTLNWSQEGGLTFVGDAIDEEAWAAGMHRLRPLLLSDEPSSFYNVASLLGKQINNRAIHAALKELRMKFRGELLPAQLTWFIDRELSMEDVFGLWVNAFEHHRDKDKREFFSKTKKLTSDHQMRHFINMLAVEKLRAIMGLFKLIIDICGEEFKPRDLLEREQKWRDRQSEGQGAGNG